MTNEGSREAGELFKRCFVAFFLVDHLRAGGFWDNSPPEECDPSPYFFQREEVLSVVELALRHLQSCSCNAYEIGEMIEVCDRRRLCGTCCVTLTPHRRISHLNVANDYGPLFLQADGHLDENLQLGGAVYPTVSLSNHACVANTVRNRSGATTTSVFPLCFFLNL